MVSPSPAHPVAVAAQAAETLLLLPGTLCDARLWAPLRPGLRGHCGAIVVGDLTGADSVAGLASRVLAEAPPRFALGGLSMGGIVALEIWRQAPGRVSRLALLDTNHRGDTPARRSQREAQVARALGGDFERVVREELKPRYVAASGRNRSSILRTVMAMALDLGPEVFARQSRALGGRADSTALLPSIDCPTLVLCGEEDALVPVAQHREMASMIPHATLRTVQNCGHLPTLERPAEVCDALIAWLRQRSPMAEAGSRTGT